VARFFQSSTPSHSGREDKPPEAQQNSQNSQHVADVALGKSATRRAELTELTELTSWRCFLTFYHQKTLFYAALHTSKHQNQCNDSGADPK